MWIGVHRADFPGELVRRVNFVGELVRQVNCQVNKFTWIRGGLQFAVNTRELVH